MVALLAEGVDRNDYGGTPGFWRLNVALLAEGVDRNFAPLLFRFCPAAAGVVGRGRFV